MHDTLRRRLIRRLETLPEAQLYQVLDYIEFLESRYGRGVPGEASPLQDLAERIEDGLRKHTVRPSAMREAFQLMAAADRVLRSVSDTGRDLFADLQPSPEAIRSSDEGSRAASGELPPGAGSPASGGPGSRG